MELEKTYYILLFILPLLIYYLQRRRRDGYPDSVKKASFILRLFAISMLILSLTGLLIPGGEARLNVIYVIDVSQSVGKKSAERILGFVSDILKGQKIDSTGNIILFGRGVEIIPNDAWNVGTNVWGEGGVSFDDSISAGTDIATALQRATSLFHHKAHNRVVLFTDGRPTEGKAVSAARGLRALGVDLLVVPVDRAAGSSEVSIVGMSAPKKVRVLEPFKLRVIISSESETEGRLDLLRDGLIIESRELSLKEGANIYYFRDEVGENGFFRYSALVYPRKDVISQNNSYEILVEVMSRPEILLIYNRKEDSRFLLRVLSAQGFEVVSGGVEKLPAHPSDYNLYQAIIIQNVPGLDFSERKMELLEKYVRDAGGGLVVVGGDNSLGGSYYRTPLERMLPVSMDSPSRLSVPEVSLALVIDKSSSMAARVGETDKLELAKIASYSALELMGPRDRVGLLAFDTHNFWAVPLIEARERDLFMKKLKTLGSGGGTDLYPAMKEAYERLKKESSTIKHMLILSDGLTEDKGFDSLVEEIIKHKITTSTIALGEDADLKLLMRMADKGGGRFYYVADPLKVPNIFLTEAMLISRKLIVEGNITPVPLALEGALKGIDPQSIPHLKGYIRTYPKEIAKVLLVSRDGDPLLATRRYGLGKTAVFTSDLSNRWGVEWLRWKEFGRFAAQLVRSVSTAPSSDHAVISHEINRNVGRLKVDLYDKEGRFVNLVAVRGILELPGGRNQELTFAQTAPGRYEADFDASRPGLYQINLYKEEGGQHKKHQRLSFSIPYLPEYASWGTDGDFLKELAIAGGGKIVEEGRVGEEAYSTRQKKPDYTELWPVTTMVGLVTYFLSILLVRWPNVARRQKSPIPN